MPETVGSLVAFLFFVTPGLAFELMRERNRPQREQTAFRETAVVVIASSVFSSAAVVVLLIARLRVPDLLPEPGPLIDNTGTYVRTNTRVVAGALVSQVALATAFAWVWHQVLRARGSDATMLQNSPWFELTNGAGPGRRPAVHLSLELDDGTTMVGRMYGNDSRRDQTVNDIVLRSSPGDPIRVRYEGETDLVELDEEWHYVIVPYGRIQLSVLSLVDVGEEPEVGRLRWRIRTPIYSVEETS